MRSKTLTILVALLMATSVIAPIAGVAGADEGPPDRSLDAVPEDNIGPPDHAQGDGPSADGGPPDHALENMPEHAAAYEIHASAHADDLEVEIGERDGELAIEFSDDVNHEGREVAISAEVLEEAIGERPDVVYGEHSSGDEWSAAVEYDDGLAVFEIPRFSSNEVTFEGSVEITGEEATDGSTFEYDIGENDDPDDFEVEIEGFENSETSTVDSSGTDSDTIDVDVGGSASPSAEWEIEAKPPTDRMTAESSEGTMYSAVEGDTIVGLDSETSDLYAWDIDSYDEQWSTSLDISDPDDVEIHDGMVVAIGENDDEEPVIEAFDASSGSSEWSETMETGSIRDMAAGEGIVAVAGNSDVEVYAVETGDLEWSANPQSWNRHVDVNDGYVGIGGSNGLQVYDLDGEELWTDSTSGDDTQTVAVSDDWVLASEYDDTYLFDMSTEEQVDRLDMPSRARDATIDGDRAIIASNSRTHAIAYDLSTNDELWKTEFNHDADRINYLDTDDETLVTTGNDRQLAVHKSIDGAEDPEIEVNGETLSHSGMLKAGESVDDSVGLALGENEIDVSIDNEAEIAVSLEIEEVTETIDPTISVNGNEATEFGTIDDGERVELDVSESWLEPGETQEIEVEVSDDYDGPDGMLVLDYTHTSTDRQSIAYEGEAFSERYNVSKTFASDLGDASLTIPFDSTVVEVRELEIREDGDEWEGVESYDLDNSTLEVDLGDVEAGTDVEVRATGSKVRPVDGEITVTSPTVLDESLSSEIRFEEIGDDFELEVDETRDADEIHYSYSESWSNPQTHARVDSSGDQALKFPNAGAGETTRLSTIPLEAAPIDGHVDVRVQSTGSEPEFDVLDSSSTSEVEFIWSDTRTGAVYQLYSLASDREIDRGEASSPVVFTHDGSEDSLVIFEVGSGSGDGAGSVGPTGSSSIQPLLLIPVAIAGLTGIYVVGRRLGDDSISGSMVFVAGAVIVGLLSVQAMAPDILAEAIGAALEEALPLLLLMVGVVLIIWLRSRGDDTEVTLDLGGDRRR